MVLELVHKVAGNPTEFPVLGDQIVFRVFKRAHLAEIYRQEIIHPADMDR